MQDKCLNYKFVLFIILPLVGMIPSTIVLCVTPYNGFAIFVFVASLLYTGLLLCSEPIFYIINKSEIRIICAFKQYCFSYKEIQQITLKYDAFFEHLFVKDYRLILDMQIKIPERCKRIFKCSKTKKLIEKYYNEKVNL